MKRVAISVSTRLDGERAVDYLPQAYVTFLDLLGLCPVLIPNGHPNPAGYARAMAVEGLVLSGGGDIDPAVYGAPNTRSHEIVPQRDAVERTLFDLALAQGWPVLGICRGFQMVNVCFGGTLVQDIPTELATPVGHDGGLHEVTLAPGAIREALGADRLVVNTHHHQAVTVDRLAPGLEVFALSAANGAAPGAVPGAAAIVEGVRHRKHPVLAVQWHPERRNYPAADRDLALFGAVFDRGWWR